MYAHDVRQARRGVRQGLGWMREHHRLRRLPDGSIVRRWGYPKSLRLHADHVRRTGRRVRRPLERMRRGADLRSVPLGQDVRAVEPLRRRPMTSRGVFIGLAVALSTSRALAAAEQCAGPSISSDAHVPAAFGPAVKSLREELRPIGDVDTCGKVSILGAGDAVVVHVVLRDGRTTFRRVARSQELSATVASLLLLPRGVDPEHREVEGPDAPPAPAEPPAPALQPIAAAARIGLEGGGGLGGRLAQGSYVGLGAVAFGHVLVNDWLLGLHFRASLREVLASDNPSGFHLQTAAFAAHAGRRFSPSPVSIDVAGGPSLVFESQDLDRRRQEADHPAREGASATSQDVRLGGLVRVSTDSRPFRLFGVLDGDISPSRAFGTPRRPIAQLPALPAWSVGFSLGVIGAAF